MAWFEKFINTRKGQILWYLIMLFITFSPPYPSAGIWTWKDFVAWVATALMAWYGISYAKNLKTSYLKLWKIFAILLPLPTYTLFLILHVFNISRAKIFLLVGSAIFFIIAFVISYQVATYTNLVDSIVKSHEKVQINESRVNTIYKKIASQTSLDKELYKESMQINQEQLLAVKDSVTKINELESTVITTIFPEIKTRISTQKNHYEQYLKGTEVNVEWNKEVLKDNPDNNKIDELLKKSNIEQGKAEKTLTEVEKLGTPPTFLKVITSHLWSLSVMLVLGILGLVLLVINLIVVAKNIQKRILASIVGWSLVGLINLIGVAMLILTLFLF